MSNPIASCRRRACTLRRTPMCPGLTRAWALGWARTWNVGVLGLDYDDFETDVSELATNAIRHAAGDQIIARLTLRPDSLRFAVVDLDPRRLTLPTGCLEDLDAEGGRGLLIVQATSATLGCRQYQDRKSVYAVWGLRARITAEGAV